MSNQGKSSLALPVGSRDHMLGSKDALITLVEYGDYECPHCKAAHEVLKRVLGELGGKVLFVFRHFPISTVHPNAKTAAEAAEAAASQGRFWEMHNILFENQDSLDIDSIKRYATTLNMNLQRFEKELLEHVHSQRVREDFMSGVRSGVNGTPTFFINGTRYWGAITVDSLTKALEGVLKTIPTRKE
ncbi:MAG: DsbA family protein [Nitrososphaeria archaeon]